MTTGTYIIPTAIYVEKVLDTSHAVHVMDDRAHLVPRGTVPSNARVIKIDGIVAPGFLDLQVNGGGGVLFNDDPSPQAIDHIRDTHAQYGTIGILPTVITDAPDVIDRAADAVIAHGQTDYVLGIHIEGPHISQGRRGTHSSELIRPFDERTFATLCRLRDANITTKLTLAPEVVDPETVHRIAKLGVIVSIGHTVASNAQTWAAIDAGASCATHLMNAMPPLINRDPGPVVAIMNAGLACGIICDGIHVQDEMIKLALRAHAHPERRSRASRRHNLWTSPDWLDVLLHRAPVLRWRRQPARTSHRHDLSGRLTGCRSGCHGLHWRICECYLAEPARFAQSQHGCWCRRHPRRSSGGASAVQSLSDSAKRCLRITV